MKKVSPNQQVILDYVRSMGGSHVFIGPTIKADCFGGWEWHEVERPLKGLVKRGLLREIRRCFYYLP